MKLVDNKAGQRSFASLAIYSRTESVGELERLFLLPPDRSADKGTRRGRMLDNVHPHSVVVYESHLDRADSVGAHLDDLLARLNPAKGRLRDFAQRARMEGFQSASGRPFAPIVLWLYVYAGSPQGPIGLDISSDQLQAIAEFGADLALEVETDHDREYDETDEAER
jgi:hypothetical protein